MQILHLNLVVLTIIAQYIYSSVPHSCHHFKDLNLCMRCEASQWCGIVYLANYFIVEGIDVNNVLVSVWKIFHIWFRYI